MEVERTRATETAAAAFEAYGIGAADARLSAEVLVSADARGKHSHGLRRLPRFVRGIEADNVDPDGEIEVVEDSGATATLDGGSRLGPVVAIEAAVVAMDRANEHGIGCVGVHDSNHLGMLGYYTDELRRAGYVGIGMTNTEPAMPPHGGREPILGTNPIAIGLPTDPPFNLDMSTAAIARGTVEHRQAADEPLPEGVALDADGEPTTDPAAALDGTIRPFGGTKGSGLAIAVEVLAGGLVGAAMGRTVTGTYHTDEPCTKGDLFVAIDPAAMGASDFGDRASAFFERLRASETATGVEAVRVPGERSIERDRTASTIEIDPDLWERVRSLSGDR